MHPFKPQLKIFGRALSSQLYHCSSLKRLGRKAVLVCKEAIQKKEKILCMSSLLLTGKCLLCARAHTRLGTCSVLRLLYKLAISLIRVSWSLPSHSFLIHLAEEQKKSTWLCLWFLYHCLLCIILCNPSANFNFTSYSLCLNSAFLYIKYLWKSLGRIH